MSLSASLGERYVPGANFDVVTQITLDAAYPAGGYIVTAATFGLQVLRRLVLSKLTSVAAGAYEIVIVPTLTSTGIIESAAIHAVVGSTGVEVATGASVATVSFELIATGA